MVESLPAASLIQMVYNYCSSSKVGWLTGLYGRGQGD